MTVLIPSPKHTKADLDAWGRYDRYDSMPGIHRLLDRKEAKAMAVLSAFCDSGPCYVGVSWGKDSVVVAHLALRAFAAGAVARPLVWVRVEPIANPDCASVRDELLRLHPRARRRYHEIETWCECDESGWHATGTLECGFVTAAEVAGSARHVSGVRAEESSARELRMASLGESSARTCAPIGWWSGREVFAYLRKYGLPVHPAYAMSWGGTLDRTRIRVASLGGERGTGHGRRLWEEHYYGDELAEIDRLAEAPGR